jgi:hypothetical protein
MELELYKVKKDICILSHDNEMLEIPKGSLVQPRDSQHYEIMVFDNVDGRDFDLVKIKNSVIANKEIFEQISSIEFYKKLTIFEIINNIRHQELNPEETITKIAKAFNLHPIFLGKPENYAPISSDDLFPKCSCGSGMVNRLGTCTNIACPNIVFTYTTTDPIFFTRSNSETTYHNVQ